MQYTHSHATLEPPTCRSKLQQGQGSLAQQKPKLPGCDFRDFFVTNCLEVERCLARELSYCRVLTNSIQQPMFRGWFNDFWWFAMKMQHDALWLLLLHAVCDMIGHMLCLQYYIDIQYDMSSHVTGRCIECDPTFVSRCYKLWLYFRIWYEIAVPYYYDTWIDWCSKTLRIVWTHGCYTCEILCNTHS